MEYYVVCVRVFKWNNQPPKKKKKKKKDVVSFLSSMISTSRIHTRLEPGRQFLSL